MSRRRAAVWRVVALLSALLALPGCLIVVSTGPTSVSEATIIFVAITDDGALVAALHVSVVAVDTAWHDEGTTASDGAFRCDVGPGVRRVRAGVTLPPGYVIAGEDRWPREIDVPTQGSVEVQIRVKAASR